MDYNAPTGSVDPNAPYVGKNVGAGIQGSKVPPKAIELTQREIVNAITDSGQTPSNDDPTQLAQAIRRNIPIGTAGGTANAITTALSPVPSAWAKLRLFLVKITTTNTDASTIAPNGLSPRSIKRNDGATNVGAGDLPNGGVALFLNDGTNVQLVAMLGATAAALGDNLFWHFCGTPAGGTANALTAVASPVPASLTTPMHVILQASAPNTGAATLNLNGLGVKSIVNRDGSALQAGQLNTTVPLWLMYDGTNFVLMDPVVTNRPRIIASYDGRTGAIQGMTLSTSGALIYTFTLLNPPPNGYSVGTTPGVSSYGNTTTTFQPTGTGGIGTGGKSASQFALCNYDAGGNHNALGDVVVIGW